MLRNCDVTSQLKCSWTLKWKGRQNFSQADFGVKSELEQKNCSIRIVDILVLMVN